MISIEAVTRSLGFPLEEIRAHRRGNPDLIDARQMLHYVLVKHYDMSFSAAANFTNRNHATVIYSYNKVQEYVFNAKKPDKRLLAVWEKVKEVINAPEIKSLGQRNWRVK